MTGHPLLVFSRPDQDRAAVASWVRGAVAAGERVVFRLAPGVTAAVVSAELARAGVDPAAIDSEQVGFLDASRLATETGGRHDALRESYTAMVERARDAGYTGLAVTGDGPALHASTRDERELRAHERDLDELTTTLPLRVLCRYHCGEGQELLAGLASVHHRAITDVLWDAELVDGCLHVRGEIDISNTGRFAAVLRAARREGTQHVDLSGLRYCAAAGLGVLTAAAEEPGTAPPLVLHDPSRSLARLLRIAGTAGTGLRIEDGAGTPWPAVPVPAGSPVAPAPPG